MSNDLDVQHLYDMKINEALRKQFRKEVKQYLTTYVFENYGMLNGYDISCYGITFREEICNRHREGFMVTFEGKNKLIKVILCECDFTYDENWHMTWDTNFEII